MIKIFIVGFLFVVFSGCATLGTSKVNETYKLRTGMSQLQVQGLLGQPETGSSTGSGAETWSYLFYDLFNGQSAYRVSFQDGSLMSYGPDVARQNSINQADEKRRAYWAPKTTKCETTEFAGTLETTCH